MMLFSTHLTLVPIVKKYHNRLITVFSENGTFECTPIKPILEHKMNASILDTTHYSLYTNNDDISQHFPTSFAIKSNVYILTHHYLCHVVPSLEGLLIEPGYITPYSKINSGL